MMSNLTEAAAPAARAAAATECTSSWQQVWQQVRYTATRLGSGDSGKENEMIEELLVVLDGEDPLLAFMAMQPLRRALVQRFIHKQDVARYAKLLLRQTTLCPSACRFQLLRQLIKKTPSKEARATNGEESDGSSDDDEDDQDPPTHQWLVVSILDNVDLLGQLMANALRHDKVNMYAAHEALLLLTDIAKRVSGQVELLESRSLEALCHVIECTMKRVSVWCFDSDSVPRFVTCGLLDLVLDSRRLFKLVTKDDQAMQRGDRWLAGAINVIAPYASISTRALRLFNDTPDSDPACAESFITTSGKYPFLQKWIQLCCLTAAEALDSPNTSALLSAQYIEQLDAVIRLVTRSRLMAIIMEQDDVMVDALLHSLAISRLVKDLPVTSVAGQHLRAFAVEELDPDIMFADLLCVFSDDHLVLLDMLMSSETRLLEYMMQYLRRASTSWATIRDTWQRIGRCDAIMAVLIRLRLEMERLLEAGVFPYNPTPLLRRLEGIESMYEDEDDHRTRTD